MKIAIIGAGPAGLMAAVSVIHKDKTKSTVFDKNDKPGKKLYITGKGRCNFTNDCLPEEFLRSVVSNPKFLYSSIYKFSPRDAIDFIERNGCPTKIERGNRVFPVSDKASDITKALVSAAQKNGAEIKTDCNIKDIKAEDDGFELMLAGGESVHYDKVIIATGGKSYPSTGSTGDGYKFAASFGHTIVEPRPSLVSIKLKDSVFEIEGLSLKNVEAEIRIKSKNYKEFGEMLFTKKGVSGPIILSLSSYFSKDEIKGAELSINLKPALTLAALDKRVLRDFEEFSNKQLKNALDKLLPKSLIPYIINYAALDGYKPVNLISRVERARLIESISKLTFTIDDRAGFEEAIVTSGGVSVKEINPATMESKLKSGLFFAGEIIDVDALTGGFNIQIALSTGYIAGKSIN